MRVPSFALRRRAAAVLFAAICIATLGGCEPQRQLDSYGVRRLDILLDADTMRPGTVGHARAIATDRDGAPVDAPVQWRSLTPATLAVSGFGELQALAPGIGVVRAIIGSVYADRRVDLVNPPVASIAVLPESLLLNLPGAPATLSAQPRDAAGAPIVGATIAWSSLASRIATVDAGGTVRGVAVGRSAVQVSADGSLREVPVRVLPAGGPNAPLIDSVVPAVIVPGNPFTVYGSRLSIGMVAPSVGVGGFPAQVSAVGATQLTAMLPTSLEACEPRGAASVQVGTSEGIGARDVVLALAPRRAPAVGSAALLLTAATAACVELPAEGRYVVTLLNAARALGAGSLGVRVELRGGTETVASGAVVAAAVTASAATASSAAASPSRLLAGPRGHYELLERARHHAASQPAATAASLGARAALQIPPANGLTAVRVPDLDDPRLCIGFRPITARTVYSGTRIAILEDTSSRLDGAPLLTGQMDAVLGALGAEVETVIWPLIERFGNPLVMDERLDANGKVAIVVTPALNAMRGGDALAAVVTCDFFPRASTPASNVGEMLYLQVPEPQRHADAEEALRVWRAAVRGTIAHELKHVVGFAERIARGQPLEESWLEEATARHAEELYARAVTGIAPRSDAGYAALRCEALALRGDGACANTPVLMRPTLDGLYRYLAAPATHSPLGPTAAGDDSFYGSGWALLRWAMDHATLDEAAFVRALTLSGQSGLANLEGRAGRSWDEMLTRWALASLTDGRPGLESTDATLRYPSWRLGELFAGFCEDLGGCAGWGDPTAAFGRVHPAQPIALSGDATSDIAELVPGGFVAFDLAPAAPGQTRLLRLRNRSGGALGGTARLALLRVD